MTTLKDVARACGVSQATVSQVLNKGARPVHPGTRERVLQAARSLDYRPNAIAQGLAGKRMNTIGLAFLHNDGSFHANPFMLQVLNGVLLVTTRRRQNAMLHTISDWDAGEDLHDLSDGRCDGIILLVPPQESPLPGILQRRKIPVVVVNAPTASEKTFSIDVDNVGAARELTEHLLQLGHRRIAFVEPEYSLIYSFSYERQQGYRQAMAAAGLSDPALADLPLEQALRLDLAAPDRPTALFCTHDDAALSLLEGLQRRGVRVPEDVSIVGFDDIAEASLSRPPLTTVRQPMLQIGERAAEMLMSVIEGASSSSRREILPTELVVRQSTGPPTL